MKKKLSAFLLTLLLIFAPSSRVSVSATAVGTTILAGAASFALGAAVPNLLSNIISAVTTACKKLYTKYEVSTYQGYRRPSEITKKLRYSFANEIFGQEKAKNEVLELLSSFILSKNNGENIICFTGPNGTGRASMISAITNAMLKHPDRAVFVYRSEQINNESDLASQLFGTVPLKDVSSSWNQKTVLGTAPTLPKEEKSALLNHLENWHESIVIIENYNKMKLKSKNATADKPDKSADGILASIESSGKYRFMNQEIDCSRTLFLITVDETKEKFEETFGTNGDAKKLNIVDLEYLDIEACKKIIRNMIINVKDVLINQTGDFKIKNIEFDDESINDMASYIFENKSLQGWAKNKLMNKIFNLFLQQDIDTYENKSFKITYSKQDDSFQKI